MQLADLGRCVSQARALLVINHVSYLDALVMGQVFMPCGLAKSAVTNIPCVGTFACALQVCCPFYGLICSLLGCDASQQRPGPLSQLILQQAHC